VLCESEALGFLSAKRAADELIDDEQQDQRATIEMPQARPTPAAWLSHLGPSVRPVRRWQTGFAGGVFLPKAALMALVAKRPVSSAPRVPPAP